MAKCIFTCTHQICFIIIVVSLCITGYDFKRKGDKLILSPVELVDLVREEQERNISPNRVSKHFEITTDIAENDVEDTDIDTTECEDSKTLKRRKIWSRWSKWGACSVTCGGGTLVRRRLCVAGRCACGEREEQRRLCARAPCRATNDLIDDSRELE